MEDRLKDLMQELGNAINESLSDSDRIASAIGEIKRAGYDVFLVLEATIGFNKREEASEDEESGETIELSSLPRLPAAGWVRSSSLLKIRSSCAHSKSRSTTKADSAQPRQETDWRSAAGWHPAPLIMNIVTHSEEETIELGRVLARRLPSRAVVLLIGNLGAGKTTLAKGIVSGLGAAPPEEVSSPTFTLIHEYGEGRVYHVDLYRLEQAGESRRWASMKSSIATLSC